MKRPTKSVRPPDELAVLAAERRVLTTHRLVGKRAPIASDLLTILDGSLGRTLEHLLSGLAALTDLSSAAKGQTTDVERRGSPEPPLPSFQSAWASRRLEQVDRNLWELAENVENFVNSPSNPDHRQGQCVKCGIPYSSGDVFCRQCGQRISAQSADERLRSRVQCLTRGCSVFKVYQPKWFRAGRDTWIENSYCNGIRPGGVCQGKLRDV